ncbi:MAG TPA: carbohydrate kinase family protein [Candidatus Nanoarchaeia archaeon]|nr:carbohydrate kinase family protein [Candidatus Nanoarchaeia archaeon]
MSKYDVLCVGSATVDTFLTIEQSFSSLKLGDKVLVKSVDKRSGGGATNSASALVRLGLKVKTATKIGDDDDGNFILKELKADGVENICHVRSKQQTDLATIISSTKEKDRIILVHKGASTDLSSRDLQSNQLTCSWIYLATLTGKSQQTAFEIAKLAKKKNIKLLFNPSLYLAQKGKKQLSTILQNTQVLVLNKEEAQAVLKSHSNDFQFLLTELQKSGPKIVIVTNGRKGLYAVQKNMMYSLTKTPEVKIVHTAGAGDAFTSGFLAGLIKSYSFEEALRLGQINASSVIQHVGAKVGQLTETEAKMMMKKYEIKITEKEI